MQRQYRLTQGAEFKRVRRQGRSYSHPLLVLYARPGGGESTRTGISVGRRIGKAVTRNRVKRLIREALRLRQPQLATGWELLFIARAGAAGATFREISEAVEQGLWGVGVLQRESEGAPLRAAPPAESGRPSSPRHGRESET